MILTYTRFAYTRFTKCNYNGGVRETACVAWRDSRPYIACVCSCVFHFCDDWFVTLTITSLIVLFWSLLVQIFGCFYYAYSFEKELNALSWAYVHEIYYANNPEFLNGLICLLFLFTFQFSSLLFGFCSNFNIIQSRFDSMILCVVGCASVCLCVHVMLAKLFPNRARIQAIQLHHRNAILCIEYFIVCHAKPCHAMPWKWTKIEKYQATTRVVKLELKCYAAIWRLCDSLYKWMRSRARLIQRDTYPEWERPQQPNNDNQRVYSDAKQQFLRQKFIF